MATSEDAINRMLKSAMNSDSGYTAADVAGIGLKDIKVYRRMIIAAFKSANLSNQAILFLFQIATSVKNKDRLVTELKSNDSYKNNAIAKETMEFLEKYTVMSTATQSDGKISILKITPSFPEMSFWAVVASNPSVNAINILTQDWVSSLALKPVAEYVAFLAQYYHWNSVIRTSKYKTTKEKFDRGFDTEIFFTSAADAIPFRFLGEIVSTDGNSRMEIHEIGRLINLIHNMTLASAGNQSENLVTGISKMKGKETASVKEMSTPIAPKPMVLISYSDFSAIKTGQKTIRDLGHYVNTTGSVVVNFWKGKVAEEDKFTNDEKKEMVKKMEEDKKKLVKLTWPEVLYDACEVEYGSKEELKKVPKELEVTSLSKEHINILSSLAKNDKNMLGITDAQTEENIKKSFKSKVFIATQLAVKHKKEANAEKKLSMGIKESSDEEESDSEEKSKKVAHKK